MVVRGDLTTSLIDPIIRYFDDKNGKKYFSNIFWAIKFLSFKNAIMKSLLFNIKREQVP